MSRAGQQSAALRLTRPAGTEGGPPDEVVLPAKTILVAAGTQPNTVLAREDPQNIALDGRYFRALDEDGKPAANLRIVVRLLLDGKGYANLPTEHHYLGGNFNIVPGSWRTFTGREATTDKEGRFRVEGLIPGEKYNLFGGPGDIERKGGDTHRSPGLTVTPGQEKDLGDLKQTDPDSP